MSRTEEIARLSGNARVLHLKGTNIDHCCHETAGMKRAEKKVEKLAGEVK